MSCPYFYPSNPRLDAGDPHFAMLPLGGAWAGTCHAIPAEPWQPEAAGLERRCNLGYARGECSRFPAEDGPDAIRFTVSRDDGATLRLYYVLERDHHPFAHGELEYSKAARAAVTPAGRGETFDAQVEAYAASYLRRKSAVSDAEAASK